MESKPIKSHPMLVAPILKQYFTKSSIDDFFIGIGDINSTFLPKLEPLTGPPASTSKGMIVNFQTSD